MPFQIKEDGDKFVVYNIDTNKKQGSFPDRAAAMKKMKALYAEEEKNKGKPEKVKKDDDDTGDEDDDDEED